MGSLGVFLGRGGIGPIVNMAVIVFALVYLLVCLGVVLLRFRRPGARRPFTVPLPVAGVAVMGALFVLALAVRDPYARGGGVPLEWVLLLAWLTVGGVFWLLARRVGTVVSEANRRALILGGRANGREGDR
jgi:APA family basic amino acid/polyamine antiporter